MKKRISDTADDANQVNTTLEATCTQVSTSSNQTIILQDPSKFSKLLENLSTSLSAESKLLANLYRRYFLVYKMPACAEKSLFLLTLYFQLAHKKQKMQLDDAEAYSVADLELFDASAAQQVFAQLKTQLAHEKLIDAEIESNLDKISDYFLDNQDNLTLKEVFHCCAAIEKAIVKLDILLLIDAVEVNNSTASILKNQDAILLLGTTGSGKSTTIHFLAGSELEQDDDFDGLGDDDVHIKPVKYSSKLEAVVTSPAGISETRSVNAVEIDAPIASSSSIAGSSSKQTVYLCDSPGFGDTGGNVIDIANGVSVVKALRSCRSIKPVVLISRPMLTGVRGEDVIKVLEALLLFMPNVLDYLNSLTFVFTKFGSAKLSKIKGIKKRLSGKLLALEDNSERAGNIKLRNLLTHLTKVEPIILRPTEDEPSELLSKIQEKPAFENPSVQLAEYASEKAIRALSEQVHLEYERINLAIKRSDFLLVEYKLQQLKFLTETIGFADIKSTYNSIKEALTESILTAQAELKAQYEILQKVSSAAIGPHLKRISQHLDYFASMESVREVHLALSIPAKLTESTRLQAEKIVDQLCAAIKGSTETSQFSAGGQHLSKLSQLCALYKEHFQGSPEFIDYLGSKYNAVVNQLMMIVNRHKVAAEQALEQVDFKKLNTELSELKAYKESYGPVGIKALSGLLADVYSALTCAIELSCKEWFQSLSEHFLSPLEQLNFSQPATVEQAVPTSIVLASNNPEEEQATATTSSSWFGLKFKGLPSIFSFSKTDVAKSSVVPLEEGPVAASGTGVALSPLIQDSCFDTLRQIVDNEHAWAQPLRNLFLLRIYKFDQFFLEVSTTDLNAIAEQALSLVKTLSVKLTQKVLPALLSRVQVNTFERVAQIARIFVLLNDVPALQGEIADDCNKAISLVDNLLSDYEQNSLRLLNLLALNELGTKLQLDYGLLVTEIKYLVAARSVFEVDELKRLPIAKNRVQQISSALNKFLDEVEKQFKHFRFDLASVRLMPKQWNVYNQLRGLSQLEQFGLIKSQKITKLLNDFDNANKDTINLVSAFDGANYSKSDMVVAALKYIQYHPDSLAFEGVFKQGFSNYLEATATRLQQSFASISGSAKISIEALQKEIDIFVFNLRYVCRMREQLSSSESLADGYFQQVRAGLEEQYNLYFDSTLEGLALYLQTALKKAEVLLTGEEDIDVTADKLVCDALGVFDELLSSEIKFNVVHQKLILAERVHCQTKMSLLKVSSDNFSGDDFFKTYCLLRQKQGEQSDQKVILTQYISQLKALMSGIESQVLRFNMQDVNEVLLRTIIQSIIKCINSRAIKPLVQPELWTTLENQFNQSVQTLNKRARDLVKAMESHIASGEWPFVNTALTALQIYQDAVKQITAPDIFKQLDCSNSIEAGAKQFKQLVLKEVKFIVGLDCPLYPKSNCKLVLQFLENTHSGDTYFSQLRQKLHANMLKKIKGHLVAVQANKTPYDKNVVANSIAQFKEFLPPVLVQQYQEDLKKAKKVVKQENERNGNILKAINETKNFRQAIDATLVAFKNANYQSAVAINQWILRLLGKLYFECEQHINKNDLALALNNANQWWPDFYNYVEKVSKITIKSWNTYGLVSYASDQYLFDPQAAVKLREDLLKLFKEALMKVLNEVRLHLKEKVITKRPEVPFLVLEKHVASIEALVWLASPNNTKRGVSLPFREQPESFYSALVKLSAGIDTAFHESLQGVNAFLSYHESQFEAALNFKGTNNLVAQLKLLNKHQTLTDKLITVAKNNKYLKEFKNMINRLTYGAMCQELTQASLKLAEICNQRIPGNKLATSFTGDDRRAFYTELSEAFTKLNALPPLVEHMNAKIFDPRVALEKVVAGIGKNLVAVSGEAQKTLALLLKEHTRIEDYDLFNIYYDNLVLARKYFDGTALSSKAKTLQIDLDRDVHGYINEYASIAVAAINKSKNIIPMLIELKQMGMKIPVFDTLINKSINKLLINIRDREGGVDAISKIAINLHRYEGEKQAIADMLIADFDVFKNYAIALRNEKTARFTIDDVLNKMKSDSGSASLSVDMLAKYYAVFEKLYWRTVEEGIVIDNKTKILSAVKNIDSKNLSFAEKIVEFCAQLFAYWTLANTPESSISIARDEEDTEASQTDETQSEAKSARNYLLQPHPAQVISIFRLFGIDTWKMDKSDGLMQLVKNHLIEIGTGEGKSVTLAVSATILALFGYYVDCACYSDYLSQRDYKDFEEFFQVFGVNHLIKYGTFNQLSEQLINQHADIRELLLRRLSGDTHKLAVQSALSDERILLIDEVDVFFTPDFYGNIYRPIVEWKSQNLFKLISKVWALKNSPQALRLDKIKATNEYKACVVGFGDWELLLEQTLRAMLVDIQSHELHEYVLKNNKIGYQSQHGIDYNINYRYKTIFAYFKECDNKNIPAHVRDEKVSALIYSGKFSYAEVPKQYKLIMGVTGTLRTLTPTERELLTEEYKINKFSYMPSVYGASRNVLEFAGDNSRDVVIVSGADYHRSLKNEIVTRLKSGKDTRAVMVFFESYEALDLFYKSKYGQQIKAQCQEKLKFITEHTPEQAKNSLVRQAAMLGNVVLMTRKFGRGTDFRCFDKQLNENGGVHVIQTFVSENISEEVQVKGRTARQGEKGSYSMVLDQESLERYGMREHDINEMFNRGKFYSHINRFRAETFKASFEERIRNVGAVVSDHEAAIAYVTKALIPGKKSAILDYLVSQNFIPVVYETKRILCLMDATASMTALLVKAKNTVYEMFKRANNVLAEKKVAMGFDLQFVVYRDYELRADELLQASEWETDADNLYTFIQGVKPITGAGGDWREAIEIGLAHANNMHSDKPLDAVVLIGDAPAHKDLDEVRADRAKLGESYWSQTAFSEPTSYQEELAKLRKSDVPVNAFYVKEDSSTVENFKEIAVKTDGESKFLDVNSSAGADLLTDFICEIVLSSIGGRELVDTYNELYKGYTASREKSDAIEPKASTSSAITSGAGLFKPPRSSDAKLPLRESTATSSSGLLGNHPGTS